MYLLNLIFLIILTSFHIISGSDATITFNVISTGLSDSENIFITGNHEFFGNWNPNKIELTNQYGHTWSINLRFPLGSILEFKFTRGSWETEALAEYGGVPSNNLLIVTNDTTIIFNIEKWKDIYMKSTDRQITGDFELHHKMNYPGIKPRDVIVWLPPGYDIDKQKRYPVLYMHDGQNLFDPNTSFLGNEWKVDETADSLIRKKEINPIIIVGIYNTEDRREEYADTSLGEKYIHFLIEKLKPFIDEKYRTLPNRENTAVGGSSMGGLISFILVWDYSYVFSKAICMSPAFNIGKNDYILKVKQYNGPKKNIKVYIDNGGLDLEKRLQPGIDKMLSALRFKGFLPVKDFLWFKDNKAPHNEKAWAKRIWRPLKFLFKKQ
jgi:predicted alpha/beta superfamily hydrolase